MSLPAAPPLTEARRQPPPAVRIASIALLLAAAGLLTWSTIGWLHIDRFDHAADRLFTGVAFADDDYAVSIVEISYSWLLLGASALSVCAVLTSIGMLDLWRNARVLAALVGLALIAFSARFLLVDFLGRIEAPFTGVSRQQWLQSKMQFDELTHWRLTPWMHLLGIGVGSLAVIAVLACWAALARPASRSLYGRSARR